MFAANTMGKVKYATGIDYVQGSLAKPKVKDGHSCGTYLIGTHRDAPTENPNCQGIYTFDSDRYDRTTPLTDDEIATRARFTAVQAMVRDRKADLTKITADQRAFIAQKDLAGGKKTMRAWYWMVCGAEYDTAHENG